MSDLPPMPEVAETAAGYKASFVRDFAREYARQAVAAEGERCAVLCDSVARNYTRHYALGAKECAAAIRRGSV